MAEDRDQWADSLSAEHNGGWLTSFLAEEDPFDRRMLWRLGSWGVGAVAAVTVAVLASQSQSQLRREQVASSELMARQSQQIQFVARETQTEAKRLSLAIDTLNSDRDRLYSRITSVEQGLESVTGSIKRQTLATAPAVAPPPAAAPITVEPSPAPQAAARPPTLPAPPLIGPVASTAPPLEVVPAKPVPAAPAPMPAPLMASKSMMAPPDAAATKLTEPAPAEAAAVAPEQIASVQTAAPEPAVAEAPAIAVQRTEFGIDLGGANSLDGLRALWRGIPKSNKALAGLRPIIMVKERSTGLGMQLRLVVGPLSDAAAAAKICAIMIESSRSCETSVFDGQRLALKSDTPPPEVAAPARPAPRKRSSARNERTERVQPPPKPVEEPPPPPKPQSSLTSFLGIR
ncbi:MAG: hypothetical protein JWP84_3278 [Tardiphaga sp.]|nr:hypothetical protein [Tardiphaga sp.]